ncbi:MAG: site-specific DNA-methyltransferase, partial [Actinobacteria bacterium]|nr:site-specific DNA-methyltransferase [Actinomycetota bacterium]
MNNSPEPEPQVSPSTADLEVVKWTLGEPYVEAEGALLYEGDCIELMEGLGQVFDLTITSPPYNIGKEYEQPLSLAEYVAWSERWMKAVFSCTTDTGQFWLNVGYVSMPGMGKAVPLPYLLWDKSPFFLVQEIVWNYGAGVAAKTSFSPRNEKFLWYVRDDDRYYFDLDAVRDPDVRYPNQKKNGRLKCNPLGKNPTDVWAIPKVTSGRNRSSKERTSHPAQFPKAVIERIIKACSTPRSVLLDPFLGSGTTAEVAFELGRPIVGFDIRREYLDIAAERLAQARLRSQHLP